jgi:hypothetical protein
MYEPVFVYLLRSPGIDSKPGGPVQQPYLTYRPAGPHRLAESIPGLLKRLQIRALYPNSRHKIFLWSKILPMAKSGPLAHCVKHFGQHVVTISIICCEYWTKVTIVQWWYNKYNLHRLEKSMGKTKPRKVRPLFTTFELLKINSAQKFRIIRPKFRPAGNKYCFRPTHLDPACLSQESRHHGNHHRRSLTEKYPKWMSYQKINICYISN